MISRRLIRIKTFQILYAQFSKKEVDFSAAYSELQKSANKTQDLYFLILRLMVEMKEFGLNRIEINKNKQLATEEDLAPKTAFVDNKILSIIENSLQYQRFERANIHNWSNHEDIIEKSYHALVKSDVYKTYLNKPEHSLKDDKQIITYILEVIIGESEEMIDALEEMCIYWTEDFEFVINNVLKLIRTLKNTDAEDKLFSNVYKNEDDKQFAYSLLKHTLQDHKKHVDLIEKYTKNWEVERIMQVDILLMEMALTELINMPSIPIKVSLDEYIELSKYYSSEKSKIFINGILDKAISELKSSDEIKKAGRGLIGQV